MCVNVQSYSQIDALSSSFQGSEGAVSPEEVSVILDTEQATREHRISVRLQRLNERLKTYVTSPLEVPEVKQDQLKTSVKLDLLIKLSERLQELYSEVQAMVAETCKCSEDLKKEFYDFAYHGLRAVHNDLGPRVTDLESALVEMSEEEKKDFERLTGYQVNRQRQVKRLDNLWRGLFSPVCSTTICPWTFFYSALQGSERSARCPCNAYSWKNLASKKAGKQVGISFLCAWLKVTSNLVKR